MERDWLMEEEREIFLHLEDEYRAKTGAFEMFCNICNTRIDASIEGESICRQCHGERESRHEVYFHLDGSENAYLFGAYTWEQAQSTKTFLLQYYPSVTIDGIRYKE
jgi:hypothetical protein